MFSLIDVREGLRANGFTDVSEVYRFHGWYGKKSIGIEMRDYGPDFEPSEFRYTCHATDENGHTATGQGGSTPRLAIDSVNWENLEDTRLQ